MIAVAGVLNMSEDDQASMDKHELDMKRCGSGPVKKEIPPVVTSSKEMINEWKSEESDISELSVDLRKSIERDFEYLKEVTNIDEEILYSLLLSQINNSRRVETIMGDILGMPEKVDLINYLKLDNEDGDKNDGKAEVCSAKFLFEIREMFPDVDVSFLAHECQSLDTEEDCTRFINTVMLSGVYPKKRIVEEFRPRSASAAGDNEVQILGNSFDRHVIYSSDEEISSSGLVESGHYHKKRRKTGGADWIAGSAGPSTSSNGFEVEIVKNDLNVHDHLESDLMLISDSTFGQGKKDEVQNVIRYPSLGLDACDPTRNAVPDGSLINNGNPEVEIYPEELLSNSAKSSLSPVKVPCPVEEDFEVSTTSNVPAESGYSGQDEDEDYGEYEEEEEEEEGEGEGEGEGNVSEEWIAEQTAELIRLFPNTDPSFLRGECAKFCGSVEAMNEFVISKLEKNDMPSRADYEKRQKLEELQNRYTNNFSIEYFLKVIPDPWTYFSNSQRNCAKYKLQSLIFLKTIFRKAYSRVITNILMRNNFNLYLSYNELKQGRLNGRRRKRCNFECNMQSVGTIDIQFLQEVAFIRYEEEIRDFIRTREVAKQLRFEEAKRTGNLVECQCCYDSEVMVEDVVYCPRDHTFCKSCLVKYVEVEMGQAKSEFPCLAGCGEKYTLTALQNVLKPELFSKIIQANQMEEIQAAGIQDLVQCPFCSYATIMPPEVKVLPCLNPECQKESCRLCKELSHIPLRCDEVERSEEVKMRTYIENKMTEALIRTCYKCGKSFVKEEGCNKMVCRCGAKMCYVCRKPVTGYSHFNGQGGTEYEKCPLYSTNDELHVDIVERVAEEAKAEILQANPDKFLKHDPTMVLPERSYDRPMVGINQGAAIAAGLLALRQPRYVHGQQGQRIAVNNNGALVNQGEQNRQPYHHRQHRNVRHQQQPVLRQAPHNLPNRFNIQNRVNHVN